MADDIFGVSENALQLCEQRAALITNNIVNSSTPHFKAKDINFQKALQASTSDSVSLTTTNAGHIPLQTAEGGNANTMYRVPNQQSLDGNTVDDEIERKNFIENALRYQVNLTFVQNKTEQLMHAIKGE